MIKDLIILQKIYDMILYGHQALSKFPKTERYALASDIRTCMYGLLTSCIVVNKKYYKKTTMQEMDIQLDQLRTLVRLAHDLRSNESGSPILPFHAYEYWSSQLNEIGKLLGGWIKSTEK